MSNAPNSPEGVAFALLKLVLTRQGDPQEARDYLLGLYRECLRAVIGDEVMDLTDHH